MTLNSSNAVQTTLIDTLPIGDVSDLTRIKEQDTTTQTLSFLGGHLIVPFTAYFLCESAKTPFSPLEGRKVSVPGTCRNNVVRKTPRIVDLFSKNGRFLAIRKQEVFSLFPDKLILLSINRNLDDIFSPIFSRGDSTKPDMNSLLQEVVIALSPFLSRVEDEMKLFGYLNEVLKRVNLEYPYNDKASAEAFYGVLKYFFQTPKSL